MALILILVTFVSVILAGHDTGPPHCEPLKDSEGACIFEGGNSIDLVYMPDPTPGATITELLSGPTLAPYFQVRNGIYYAAAEHETYACEGWAYYGCLEIATFNFPVTGFTPCENSLFGDPISGRLKECYCRSNDPNLCSQ